MILAVGDTVAIAGLCGGLSDVVLSPCPLCGGEDIEVVDDVVELAMSGRGNGKPLLRW